MTDQTIRVLKRKLRTIERVLGWEIGDQTECCGLTVSQRAVIVEVGSKGQTSLVDLAQSLGQDTSTLSRTINGLVNIGLVRREVKPEDRRYITLTLSEQGEATLRRIDDLSDEYFREVLAAIPAEKHKKIVDSFSLVAEALQKTCKQGEPCSLQTLGGKKNEKETGNA
jgi:DNA-binding MarR family transcriptional regulator